MIQILSHLKNLLRLRHYFCVEKWCEWQITKKTNLKPNSNPQTSQMGPFMKITLDELFHPVILSTICIRKCPGKGSISGKCLALCSCLLCCFWGHRAPVLLCHSIQFTAASPHTYCKGSTCLCHGQLDFALTTKRTKYIAWNSCQQRPLFLELILALPFSVLQRVTLFHVSEFAGRCVLFVVVTGCCWAVTRWECAPW